MILLHTLKSLTGVALIWAGAKGRLTTLVTDPDTGEDIASRIGNAFALVGGAAVVLSVLL